MERLAQKKKCHASATVDIKPFIRFTTRLYQNCERNPRFLLYLKNLGYFHRMKITETEYINYMSKRDTGLEEQLMDKAQDIIDKGGCSGATLEFLEDLVWFGWASEDVTRYFQIERMRQISQLYQA
jgi:hypothetical protein